MEQSKLRIQEINKRLQEMTRRRIAAAVMLFGSPVAAGFIMTMSKEPIFFVYGIGFGAILFIIGVVGVVLLYIEEWRLVLEKKRLEEEFPNTIKEEKQLSTVPSDSVKDKQVSHSQRLQELKSLLEQNIITQSEFDQKKAEILAKM